MTSPELSRRERKKEQTHLRIFEAAVALFRAKGFEATTVDEITEKADVGRGTFFNYFPTKDSVLAYLSESKLIAAEENSHALLAEARPVREKLIELYVQASQAYEGDVELSRFVFAEWMKRSFAPTREVEVRWTKLLLDLIEQGRAQGELRVDVAPVRAEAILSSVYIATLFQWLFCSEACGMPVQDIGDELRQRMGVVMDGLVPRAEVRP